MKKKIFILLGLVLLNSCIVDIRYIQYKRGKKPKESFYRLYDPNCDYSKSEKIKFTGVYVESISFERHIIYEEQEYSLWRGSRSINPIDTIEASIKYLVYKFFPNGRLLRVGNFNNYPNNDSISYKYHELRFYKIKDDNIEMEHLGNNDLWSINNFISYGEIKGDSIFIYASSYYGSSRRDPEKRVLVYDSTLTAIP